MHVVPYETGTDSLATADVASLRESGRHEELALTVLFRCVFATEEVVSTERGADLEPGRQAADADTRVESHAEAEVVIVVIVALGLPAIAGEEELRVRQDSIAVTMLAYELIRPITTCDSPNTS